MAGLVIAVNHHNRAPLQFVRVTHFPFRIGRAYDNDLIVADDTISGHHLQIERDENGYSVRNLSTENGTWVGKRQLGTDAESIEIPQVLEAGHTEFKILTTDTPVVPTKTKIQFTRLSTLCMDIRVALALLAVYLGINIVLALQSQAIFRDWQNVLMSELLALLTPLAVATVTGFVSRMLLHQWRFALQLSIASLVFIGYTVLPEITHFVSYLFTDALLASVLYEVLFVAGLSVLLGWQLRAVSTMTRKRSALTSVAIVLPIFALLNLQDVLNSSDFKSQPEMNTLLRSSDIRFAKTYPSIGEYSDDATAFFHEQLEKELVKAQERLAKKSTKKRQQDVDNFDDVEELE